MNKKVSFLANERTDNRDISIEELCDSSKNEFKAGCWEEKNAGVVIGCKIGDGCFEVNWMGANVKASDLIVIGQHLISHGMKIINEYE